MSIITRRHFVKLAVATAASLIGSRSSILAGTRSRSAWFLHAESCTSWPVADPVTWCLENADAAVLERASERLATLTPDDGDRIIRLVVRRCRLNLLELRSRQVVVHYWGKTGLADLRAFFKVHGLARKGIRVVLRERKREVVTSRAGDSFLFGDPLGREFCRRAFEAKWTRRYQQEADDWRPAPGTWSGFAWEGVEGNRIPWAALKSAWRRAEPRACPNCDGLLLLVNFGQPWTGQFTRTPLCVHVCSKCRRSFVDESIADVRGWLAANLDPVVRPNFVMVWGRRVKLDAEAV